MEGTESNEAHLKHYVAVYDPTTNNLQITEAKRLTVRGSIRQEQKFEEAEDEDTANFLAAQGTRAALTEAFGSKKSKKAVQSMFENRQLGQGIEGATIAEAITANIGDQDDEEADSLAASVIARSNKPLPVPNLTTDNIDEVYSISTLVFPFPSSRTLKVMPIEPWLARMRTSSEIPNLRSRFVATRISYIIKRVLASPEDTNHTHQLQLLRYIDMLLQIHTFVDKKRRHRIPYIDQWPSGTLSSNTPPDLVKKIVNHFFPENRADDRPRTLFKATIMALALHILPPSGSTGGQQLVTNTTEVQMDLAMEVADVRKLYHELGCVVKPASDRELTLWGFSRLSEDKKKKKADGSENASRKTAAPTFATLKFPLAFPKVSMGRKTAARR